ncbi:MAG: site-2 protease family protein [Chloroflexota bacterium]|nr:MAG: site-2 protease family protein [Chloroflexota bacterium]
MVLALLIAITIHEFSHALVANRLGDLTATAMGRLTLNPIKHLDPLGTIMLVVVGFGWGKPVPVDPGRLRVGPRQGMALVSIAGPASNLILASALLLLMRGGILPVPHGTVSLLNSSALLSNLVTTVISLNIILAVFNMIPLPPLDGFKVALGVLPREVAYPFSRLEQYGAMVLFLLVMVDNYAGTGVLSRIIDWAQQLVVTVVMGL